MNVLKAQFKDKAGFYTMTWSFNSSLWSARDILANEQKKSNSKLIQIISNEKLNKKSI